MSKPGRDPSDYTDITAGSNGSVSIVGKSANVKQLEQQFLASRRNESRQYQAQLAQQQQPGLRHGDGSTQPVSGNGQQTRSIEGTMRRINGWQQMDELKRSYRVLPDQQFQLGCHR